VDRATLGAVLAALVYAGEGWTDLRDAALEIGGSSFPLLLIPRRSGEEIAGAALIASSRITIFLSLVTYAVFAATLGRGLRF
jgi:hypothetical protein